MKSQSLGQLLGAVGSLLTPAGAEPARRHTGVLHRPISQPMLSAREQMGGLGLGGGIRWKSPASARTSANDCVGTRSTANFARRICARRTTGHERRLGVSYCSQTPARCVIFAHSLATISPTWALRRDGCPRVTLLRSFVPLTCVWGIAQGADGSRLAGMETVASELEIITSKRVVNISIDPRH